MQLDSKVSLITGAASGIGLGIARRFAAAGARVAIADLRLDAAQAAADGINADHPGAAMPVAMAVAMDVSNEDAVNAGVAAVTDAARSANAPKALPEFSIASALMNVTVNTGGTTFILKFDAASSASTTAAQNFRAGIIQAASILSSELTDHITISLTIDYTGTGGGAMAGPNSLLVLPYSTVSAALKAHATAGDATFSNLPASLAGTTSVDITTSQAKALGLRTANDTSVTDGDASFATDIDPASLVGVALHEITHALGRVPDGSPGGNANIFDLFRYTAPNTLLLVDQTPSAAAYFSLDGGANAIASYGTDSDPSDFNNSGIQGQADPLNEFYNGATSQYLTAIDLEQMDAIGFHLTQSPSVIASGLISRSATGYAPVNIAPRSLLATVNAPLTIKGLTVGDIGGNTDTVSVKLSVQHGTLTINDNIGVVTISGSGTGAFTLTGQLSDINDALGELIVYKPASNYSGADTLSITSTDTTHTGGPWATTTAVPITFNAVNTIALAGNAGANGADGTSPGQAGGNGTDGQTLSGGGAASPSPTNVTTVTGGQGGSGGFGAAASTTAGTATYTGPGGKGGNGGAGGGANARAASSTYGAATAQSVAIGGDGGFGAEGGPGAPDGTAGAGGNGGTATTAASAASSAPASTTVSAIGIATGGTGGNALGSGIIAGAGGGASGATARATSAGGGTVTAAVTQTGGAGGIGNKGATGGAGAASTLINAVSGQSAGGTLQLIQTAVGGAGGYAYQGPGGVGGAAVSHLTFSDPANSITQSGMLGDQVIAIGGAGGGSDSGTAQAGGTASAASRLTGAHAVVSSAASTGGIGGSANGPGQTAGAGGVASGTNAVAIGIGASAIQASASQTGGAGGNGKGGANGGLGASSALTDAVTGISNNGAITLSQISIGGNGGSATGGGAAGAAGYGTSMLTDNDTANATKGRIITATVSATGGDGGSSDTGAGGTGRIAIARGNVTGAKAISLTVTAKGGSSGLGKTIGIGGTAAAGSVAIGTTQVDSSASATGGLGISSGARATAIATGNSGTATAQTSAQRATAGTKGVLIDSIGGMVSTKFLGAGTATDTATDLSIAQFHVATPVMDTTDQGVAFITGVPMAADIATVLGTNSNIASAFAVSPSYFGLAELGGRYSVAGTMAETTTSTVTLSVDLNQLASRQHLLVGFYGGTAVGSGVTGVVLTIKANGSTLLSKSFASGAAAQTYFTNQAVDLGSLGAASYPTGIANLSISLAVTGSTVGSGFYTNMLIGDPPKAATTPDPFAEWAHQLGATGYRGSDLATMPDTGPFANLAFAGQHGFHRA
eukprot:gene7783-7849_t